MHCRSYVYIRQFFLFSTRKSLPPHFFLSSCKSYMYQKGDPAGKRQRTDRERARGLHVKKRDQAQRVLVNPPSSTSLWVSSFYHLKTLQLTFSLPGGAGTGHKSLPLLSSSCVKGPRLPNIQFSVNKDRLEKSHAQLNCLRLCSHQLEGGRDVTGHWSHL